MSDTGPPGSFTVPVEAGQILQFTRAIGVPEPGIVAPPTFLMVADHFDPAFERRPRAGEPARRSDDPDEHPELFHVEQRFDYARHPGAGDVLTARRLPPRTWEKQGRRGGRLEFIETVTEFADADGTPVVTAAWVDVRTERSHAALSTSQAADATAPRPDAPPPTREVVLVEALTRTQIVMYVAAAGDFHPLHHDDVYARDRGYPGVFAPGMLTMALTARAMTDHLGDVRLASLASRFRAQVWPGDTLTARLTEPPDAPGREVSAETVNQHGAVVLETHAVAGPGPAGV